MPRREDLINFYKIAVDEYRFEVRLNWDRMQYYAVLNSGIVAVGINLLNKVDTATAAWLSASIFGVGVATCAIGIAAIHQGNEYYRATVYKKTIYEELLGLNKPLATLQNPNATLAIATTGGMEEVKEILAGRPPTPLKKRLFRKKILSYFLWLLIVLAIIDVLAAGSAVNRALTLDYAARHPESPRSIAAPTLPSASPPPPPAPAPSTAPLPAVPAGAPAASLSTPHN